jgi:hypothetical protein
VYNILSYTYVRLLILIYLIGQCTVTDRLKLISHFNLTSIFKLARLKLDILTFNNRRTPVFLTPKAFYSQGFVIHCNRFLFGGQAK